jgi:hypothetical protein
MRTVVTVLAALCLATAGGAVAWSCGGYGDVEVQRALSNHPPLAQTAIERLRGQGQAGLDKLIAARDQRLAELPEVSAENRARWQATIARLNEIIDEVGGAKYCSVSGLFWHTDLEQAQREAERTHRPILSLRMLGKLNEEFSCANSRFFRTTLYSNREIADLLRRRFVLHWESVRPVPKVTIDFGDGRVLERTLTGNSIHYVLDSTGRPLDGLPGLHGPAAFKRWLLASEELAREWTAAPADERERFLREHHLARRGAIELSFFNDLRKLDIVLELRKLDNVLERAAENAPVTPRATKPTSAEATALAVPKRRIEIPVLRNIGLAEGLPRRMGDMDDAVWSSLAALHANDARLDETSRHVIRGENQMALLAGGIAVTKALVEDPLLKLVRNFESSIALDTVRNEYTLHRQLHEWFATGEAPADIRALNEKVYAELFLTPSSDPWLGLLPADTYTGLKNAGVRSEQLPAKE